MIEVAIVGDDVTTPPRRAGDRDRVAVQERLRDAYAQGALTLDEYEQRLDEALSAVFLRDLERLVVDLPEAQATKASPTVLERVEDRLTVTAARSAQVRRIGRSAVAALAAVAAVVVLRPWDIDRVTVFSSAEGVRAPAGEELRVLNVFGSTDVQVDRGTPAELDVLAIFGSSECQDACAGPADGVEPARVSGLSLFGSVSITTVSDSATE